MTYASGHQRSEGNRSFPWSVPKCLTDTKNGAFPMTSLNNSPNTAPPTSSPLSLPSPMVATKKRVPRTYGSKRAEVPPSDESPDADRSFDTLLDGDISTSLSPIARSRGIDDNVVSSQDTKVDDGDDEEKDSGEPPKHQWAWMAELEKLNGSDEDELTPTLPGPQHSITADVSPSPPASLVRSAGSTGKRSSTSPKKSQRSQMTAIRSDSRLSARVSAKPEASGSDGEHSPSPSPPKRRRRTPSRVADAPIVEDSESEAPHASSSKPRGSRFKSGGTDVSDRASPDPPKRKRKTTGRKPTAKVKHHDINSGGSY